MAEAAKKAKHGAAIKMAKIRIDKERIQLFHAVMDLKKSHPDSAEFLPGDLVELFNNVNKI